MMVTGKFKVIVAGNDVTGRFQPTLKSISVSRSARQEADTADIVLADPEGRTFMPETGADVVVHLGHQEDGVGLVFEGFVDTIRSSGGKSRGREISLSATSVDFKSKVKAAGLRSASDSTFLDVAKDWGRRAGIDVTVAGDLAQTFRPYWIMQHESYMSWGQRMAQELGASFKIIGRRGFFAPLNEGISASGKTLTPISGAAGVNLLDWDIMPVRGRPQFGHAVERHYDIATAQWNEVRHAIDNLGVDMDFRAPLGNANAENAAQRAKAAGKGVERAAGDGSATILGDHAAEPEAKFILTGARPGIDGEYTIDSLTHSLDKNSGFTTSLELVRPSAGAGRDSRDVGPPAGAPTRNGIEVVGGGFGGPTA